MSRGNAPGGVLLTAGQIQNGAVDYPKLSAAAQSALLAGGLRNLLMNPLFTVNQRLYAGAVTGSANLFGYDRWKILISGQAMPVVGATFTATAPAGGVQQVIEGANIIGGQYVLSWNGTATATVNGSAVSSGTPFALASGANVTVKFSGGTFQYPQLERGTLVTTFDARPYALEWQLCRRYCIVYYGSAFVGPILGYGSSNGYMTIVGLEPLRAFPSLINLNGGTMSCYFGGASVGITSISGAYGGGGNPVSWLIVASGLGAGQAGMAFTATANIALEAEL